MRGMVPAGCCWGVTFGLVALGAGGQGAGDPWFLPLCGLLVLAPSCAALPAGRALRAPLWALEAIGSWALLGFLLLFVDPRTLDRGAALALFLPALFGALASPALVWAGRRCRARCRRSLARARLQGYLIAGVPCGLLLLHALDALAPLTGLTFALLAASLQGLLLTAGLGTRATPEAGQGSPAQTADAPPTPPAPATSDGSAVPAPPVPLRPLLARPIGRGSR